MSCSGSVISAASTEEEEAPRSTQTVRRHLESCAGCVKAKCRCVRTKPGEKCMRCANMKVSCEPGLRKSPQVVACIECQKAKKKCDISNLTCSRCTMFGTRCIREKLKKQQKSSDEDVEEFAQRAAPASTEMSLRRISISDELCETTFVASQMDSFIKYFGTIFSFTEQLERRGYTPTTLYSDTPNQVLTDAILAMSSRGMGIAPRSEQYLLRAKMNAGRLRDDKSAVALSAQTMLAFACLGEQKKYSSDLLLSVVSKMSPDFDATGILNFKLADYIFHRITNPLAARALPIALQEVHRRVLITAPHVRAALLALGEDFRQFGPWDYAEYLSSTFDYIPPPLDSSSARRRLQDLDRAETRLNSFAPCVMSASPDMCGLDFSRFLTISLTIRATLYFVLGEIDTARSFALKALIHLQSVTSAFWFVFSFIDFVHILDLAMSIGDQALFVKTLGIVERMTKLVPIASMLYRALAPHFTKLPWPSVAGSQDLDGPPTRYSDPIQEFDCFASLLEATRDFEADDDFESLLQSSSSERAGKTAAALCEGERFV